MNRDGQPFTWPAQSATGVGSMPGTNPAEAAAVVLGELPAFPHLPELPGRGPGADMIGRAGALLVEMPVETTARGWRLAAGPGRDLNRAASMLSSDLDAIEEAAQGYEGPFKLQVCGPWTLAASLELNRSVEPALSDQGAVAYLADSLSEGIAAHVAEVRRRLPGAIVVLQLDEPALPGVLAGSVPTASGLRRVPAVDQPAAADRLRSVLAAAAAPTIVHCCAPGVPFRFLVSAGAGAVSFDYSVMRRSDEDAFGEAVEAGLGMVAGVVPAAPERAGAGPDSDGLAGAERAAHEAARDAALAVIRTWRRIGLPLGDVTTQVVISPGCGLARVSPARARTALATSQAAARLIPELIEEGVT